WLLAAVLRGKRETLAEWRNAATAWDRANETTLSAFERWIFKWGAVVDDATTAAEAMADAPTGELREGTRHFHVPWQIGLLDAYAGRIYLHAGDPGRAASHLERGVRACQGIHYPFFAVRAQLWLGMALEKLGDNAGACNSYHAVLDRWG